MYTPPQRNFDGNVLRRAQQAQLNAVLDANPDSRLWADIAHRNAKRTLALLGDELFDAVLAHFSDAWFEARTWRAQADAFARLHDAYQLRPGTAVRELVQAFGTPDLTPVVQ